MSTICAERCDFIEEDIELGEELHGELGYLDLSSFLPHTHCPGLPAGKTVSSSLTICGSWLRPGAAVLFQQIAGSSPRILWWDVWATPPTSSQAADLRRAGIISQFALSA